MSVFSQTELLHRSALFTTHALTPEVQAVIAAVGMTPEEIACGAAKAAAVRAAEANKANLETQKRKTNQAEKIAWEAVYREITCLTETASALFAAHEPTLTFMGLSTQPGGVPHAANGHAANDSLPTLPQGVTPVNAPSDPQSTADIIASWRALLNHTTQLDTHAQAQLAFAGWPHPRLIAAQALVEGYAKAKNDQRVAIYFLQAARDMHRTALKDLETWYLKARRVSHTAIQENAPKNAHHLHTLLGLE